MRIRIPSMLKITEKGYIILLILLIIIGSFLRFYHLGYNSFWFDEAFTLFTAKHSLAGIWDIIANNSKELASVLLTGEFNPPLFYYIEHFMLVFGQSEFVLRFVPALLGVLTIPVFYYIGKEFADQDAGIVMAALLTFSPFHVYFSQEARSFTTMLFLFSLAFFFFLVSLRINSIHSWILFAFFAALTIWTHYFAFLPVALLFVYALFLGISKGRSDIKHLYPCLLSFIIFLVISVPLLVFTIELFKKRTSVTPLWGAKGLDVIYKIFSALSEYDRSMIVLFIVLFMIGSFFLWKIDKAKTILMVGLLAIPIIVSIFLSERMPITARYLIFLLPFFFLGISLSFKPLAKLFKGKDITIILIVIFFLFQVPFLVYYYVPYSTDYSKEDWRGIAHSIEENSSRGDYVIVVPYYSRLPLDIYYNNSSDGTYEFGIQNESEIKPILLRAKNNQVFFVVTGHIKATDPDGSTETWLLNNTQRIGMTNEIELYKLNVAK
jgi:mannosyltransferase